MDMPMASASIDVATASKKSSLWSRRALSELTSAPPSAAPEQTVALPSATPSALSDSALSCNASHIILAPMKNRITNAIMWEYLVAYFAKLNASR